MPSAWPVDRSTASIGPVEGPARGLDGCQATKRVRVLLRGQVQRRVGGGQVGVALPAVGAPANRDLTEDRGQAALVSGLDRAAGNPRSSKTAPLLSPGGLACELPPTPAAFATNLSRLRRCSSHRVICGTGHTDGAIPNRQSSYDAAGEALGHLLDRVAAARRMASRD